jgi:hypothetical protein
MGNAMMRDRQLFRSPLSLNHPSLSNLKTTTALTSKTVAGRCVGQHLRKSPLVETKIETTKNRSAKKSRKNHGSHII